MKNRGFVCFLSVLLLVTLLCGLVPSAWAEGWSSIGKGREKIAVTAGAQPTAADEYEDAYAYGDEDGDVPARVDTLVDFLKCVAAAKDETDLCTRLALFAEARELWKSYMAQVLMSVEAEEPDACPNVLTLDDYSAEDPYADAYAHEESAAASQQPIIGLPNPWTETDSLEEAIDVSGIALALPDGGALPQGMELFFYRAMPGTIEADYSDGESELMIRASTKEEGYALAGDYNTYSREWRENVGGLTVDCLGDGRSVNVAAFRDGDTAYALVCACGREGAGLPTDALKILAAALTAKAPDGADPYADEAPDIYADPQPQARPRAMEEEPAIEKNGEIMILYTGKVGAAIDQGFGYAGLKELRDSLEAEGYTTVLADTGDALLGEAVGTVSEGRAVIDLMNALEYDFAVPGAQELALGADRFEALGGVADFPYISCSLRSDGDYAMPLCAMVACDGLNIAFIGVTAPTALDDSQKDKTGYEAMNGEALWAAVQESIDLARSADADLVCVLGNLGEDAADELIANTAGVDALFDGLARGRENRTATDREGKAVMISGCGEKLSGIGFCRVSADGRILETGVWAWPNTRSAQAFFRFDNDVAEMVEAIKETLAEKLAAAEAPAEAAPQING